MGIDFRVIRIRLRVIRIRLRFRLFRLYWRTAEAQLKLVKRAIDWIGAEDKAGASELEARVQEMGQQSKKNQTLVLYTSIGKALCHWAEMEDLLVAIASMLLRTHEANKVGIILYSINFNVWLNIIDELFLHESLYAALKTKWNKINSRLMRLKDTRNSLAHHTIYYEDHISTFTYNTSLRPARFDIRQKSQKNQPSLDFDQISKFDEDISKVQEDLRELLTAMTGLLTRDTSQQKYSEPTPD